MKPFFHSLSKLVLVAQRCVIAVIVPTVFLTFSLVLAVFSTPFMAEAVETSLSNEWEAIEMGLSAIRTVNMQKFPYAGEDALGRYVCDKIAAVSNSVERLQLQNTYYTTIMTMTFNRKDWHETEVSISRFLDLAFLGLHYFGKNDEERWNTWNVLLKVLIRSQYEIESLERQVSEEIAARTVRLREYQEWQDRCHKLNIPTKCAGVREYSGPYPTARGAKAEYKRLVTMYVDGESLQTFCRGLSEKRRRMFLENVNFSIGRYPEWYVPPNTGDSGNE